MLHNRKLAEDLQFAIKRKKDNILLLKKQIDASSANTKSLTKKCQELTTANRLSQKQVPQYIAKCRQFADYIEKTDDRNAKQNEQKTELYDQLKQCRIQNIQKLIKYIFPLSQRVTKGETVISATTADANANVEASTTLGASTPEANSADSSSSATAETMNALAEATQTTYIRGRWVLQDNGELQHVIVAPSLPGT